MWSTTNYFFFLLQTFTPNQLNDWLKKQGVFVFNVDIFLLSLIYIIVPFGKDTFTKLPLFVDFFCGKTPRPQEKVLKTGFLFAAAEFGNHALYQFQGIGTDEEDPMCTSSHPHGAQVREDFLVTGELWWWFLLSMEFLSIKKYNHGAMTILLLEVKQQVLDTFSQKLKGNQHKTSSFCTAFNDYFLYSSL